MWNGYSTTNVPQWEKGKSSISKNNRAGIGEFGDKFSGGYSMPVVL